MFRGLVAAPLASCGAAQAQTVGQSVTRTLTSQANDYKAKFRFATRVPNALLQSKSRTHDEGHGEVPSLTGPNRWSTTLTFDGWGRKLREDRADTTATTWLYRQSVDSCLNGAVSGIVSRTCARKGQTRMVSR